MQDVSAEIIDGKAIAAQVRAEVARDVAAFTARTGRRPGLATVLVGDDPASAVYVGSKQQGRAARSGSSPSTTGCRPTRRTEEVEALIEQLNADDAVSGILCQLPVPDHLDGVHLTGLIDARQGRRRADAAERRLPGARARGAAAVHAGRRDACCWPRPASS